jgi:uncharacterized RDD family membrane protein YckC
MSSYYGLLGGCLGSSSFKVCRKFGSWGLLVGFFIALTYFAILESNLGGGRTLGKRICKLRVVDARGGFISLKTSLVRYSLFAAPYFLVSLRYPADQTNWIVLFVVIFISLGIGGATIYLLVFNRRTKQGFHDFVADTYVVKEPVSGLLDIGRIWRVHWQIVCAFWCDDRI